MKNKYRVDTIERWTTEIEAESKGAAEELVNDGDEGTKRTLTMITTENVWECSPGWWRRTGGFSDVLTEHE